jgi:hypothetical protein
MSENDRHQTSEFKQAPTRCYEKPELRDYGDISSLTQDRGNTGPMTDGGAVSGFTKTN